MIVIGLCQEEEERKMKITLSKREAQITVDFKTDDLL